MLDDDDGFRGGLQLCLLLLCLFDPVVHRYVIATLIIAVTIAVIGTAMANVMPATVDEDSTR